MDVLLTDGNERTALAAARSLVRAGWDVGVAAGGRKLSLAGVSRGVRRFRLSTDPFVDPAGYAAEVGDLVRRFEVRVVLPVTDASVEAILGGRQHIPASAVMPFPDLETYRAASNKAEILAAARDAGLAVPETILIEHADEALPDRDFFPAVLKPHRSVIGGRRFGAQFVKTADQCRIALRELAGLAFPVLLQRRIRGPGEGLFVLRWDGRVIAEFAHRRLREKPPEGGVSVYRESIALDSELAAAGRRLLEELNWQGVAMIECKRDDNSGRHVFMEINGRLWGSLQLAIDAGVDFPRLLVSCALGRRVPPVTQYRVGVRSRWFWGEVDHLYLQLRNGGGLTGKLAALRDFLRDGFRRKSTREEIWRWRDPAPFLLESLQQFGVGR